MQGLCNLMFDESRPAVAVGVIVGVGVMVGVGVSVRVGVRVRVLVGDGGTSGGAN